MTKEVSIKQQLKVLGSEKDGYVIITQSVPMFSDRVFEYEIPEEHLEATLKQMEQDFEKEVKMFLDKE